MNKTACRLYLITPPALVAGGLAPAAFADPLAEALDAGDVACVQLRLKGVDDDAVRRAADVLRPVVQAHDVAFLMNDRPDLAVAAGCDGVHIGQDDVPYAEARRTVGSDAIVGVTCHDSRHLAMIAADAGADYVAFGSFFATATKPTKTRASVDLLAWWSEIMVVPCVAIGGITAANCAPLVAAGADFIAVSAAVWDAAEGPASAVFALNAAIAEALRTRAEHPVAPAGPS